MLRGLFLVAFSVFFLGQGLGYSFGTINQVGPALFPVAVSTILCSIGIVMTVGALLGTPKKFLFRTKNVGIVIASLVAFALISASINMIVAIVALVAISSAAARTYSVRRSAIIAATLIAIAVGFQKLLGLDLPLY